jgi:hypothetical protein
VNIMSIITRYRQLADERLDDMEAAAPAERRVPLTASQHILHLLLSIVTGGIWLPVWFIRAWRGNPVPRGLLSRLRR